MAVSNSKLQWSSEKERVAWAEMVTGRSRAIFTDSLLRKNRFIIFTDSLLSKNRFFIFTNSLLRKNRLFIFKKQITAPNKIFAEIIFPPVKIYPLQDLFLTKFHIYPSGSRWNINVNGMLNHTVLWLDSRN